MDRINDVQLVRSYTSIFQDYVKRCKNIDVIGALTMMSIPVMITKDILISLISAQ